ncbi:IclR family transcriptional regulator C-terminal domain-containing protein [Martelella sp. HB161492]|uniref:IclR family transcriptional regulator n=1 Tax=Martelella sp. HB161492 TaxID=2720726 RepID=UPI0015919C4C|nr:IclR family transcriptional regulator C-terminal domain-containing protein [Martelella sp. HB161492]
MQLDENDKEVSLTFAKGLAVIRAFDGRDRAITISEIAEKVKLNRAVARRLVRTLEQLGYLSADRGRYELTPHILTLSQGFIEGRGIAQIVQPILRNATEAIGEAVSFAMRDGNEAVYVAHSVVPSKFTLNRISVGSRAPLLPTAIGRAILAFLSDEERDAALAACDHATYTQRTETDNDRLRGILDAVRDVGYSWTEGEYVDRVCSLAVPVLSGTAGVVGSVSIIHEPGQYDPLARMTIVGHLKRCADNIGSTF